jgi:radical SAM/Cys-rich protein
MASCTTPTYTRHNFKDAGRACPIDYKLDQAVWKAEPTEEHTYDALLVVGGLYGNPFAMDEVHRMVAEEQKLVGENGKVGAVFNGDMHWFDRTAEEFARIERGAENFIPMVGNVEAEVRRTSDIGVGCGCAYPDCTDDASVSRSNRIHHMMREEVQKHPELIAKLANRPGHMVAKVGDCKIGITHGDEKLLGGWDCAIEQLEDVMRQGELSDFMRENAIDIFATTHTCAAVAGCLQGGVVINNGAAGLPTFAGQHFGILTRIAKTPNDDALYRTQYKDVYIEAVPVRYDHEAYIQWFDELWKHNSPGEVSYRNRIVNGPACYIGNALLGGFEIQPKYKDEAYPAKQAATKQDLEDAMAKIMYFEDMVPNAECLRTRENLTTIQVNVGKKCNLSCAHCHVGAGPNRTEVINRETLQAVLNVGQKYSFKTIDITGGAPEMAPDFEWFIEEATKQGFRVLVRTNLTILAVPAYAHLIQKYAELGVTVIASLPNFSDALADEQRGNGVFEKSIEILHKLNEEGYGMSADASNESSKENHDNKNLELNLVFNPQRDILPPDQQDLEDLYRKELHNYGIEFNHLYAVTNNPIGRYGCHLLENGIYPQYMNMLLDAFNPAACENLMCRDQISVGYDGRIYDCDFNQVMEMPCQNDGKDLTIFDLADRDFESLQRDIRFDVHCYGCTAGAGSSCGGTLVQG